MPPVPYEIVHRNTSKLPRSVWLALRRLGIGSSDAATCLDLNPWNHPYALMADKLGMLADGDATEHQHWGNRLERIVLDEWCVRHAAANRTCRRHLMLRSKQHPHMLGNPDLLAPDVVVECKTADKFDRARWDEGVPDHYVIQGHHLMIVSGRRRTVYPVLFGGNDYQEFEVEYTPKVAENVVKATTAFWTRVHAGDWPDPDGSEAAMLAVRARFTEWTPGVPVELPESLIPRLLARPALAEQVTAAKREIDDLKALVMEFIGEAKAERATVHNETVATWKVTKTGSRQFLWK